MLIFLCLKYIITICFNVNRGKKLQEIIDNFKHEIIKKKDSLDRISQSKFGINLSDLKVSYNLKGQRAGIVNPVKKEIRLNIELCNNFPEKMINEVLVHEIAHYINFCLNPSAKPHGNEWKCIAKALGLDNPKTTHDMPTTKARKVRGYKYKCRCSTYTLSSIRHNRIKRKEAEYACKYCGEKLKKA